tara:strand:- start:421 stop:1302 length:882 start_codon:yes stop_codon:yes gene_type:complete
MSSNIKNIGFIGTGIIGFPMAKNLIKSNYPTYAFVRNARKAKNLEKIGCKVINELGNFYHKIDILILAVSDTKDVKDILVGKNGLTKFKNKPNIVIDMSTICPIETISLSKKLAKQKISLIDAPVSGGEIGAIKGSLSIMLGGEKNIVKKVMPIMKILGEKITHVGKSGAGQVAKACNQLIVGQTINAVGEAFIMADKFNVNKNNIREALLGGFANSKILEIHGKRMLENKYAPGFKTKLHAKDMRIVKNISKKKKLNLPGANIVHKIMNLANKSGHSEKDSSAYYLTLKNKK